MCSTRRKGLAVLACVSLISIAVYCLVTSTGFLPKTLSSSKSNPNTQCITPHEIARRFGLPGPCDETHLILRCENPYTYYLQDPQVLSSCGMDNSSYVPRLKNILIKDYKYHKAKCIAQKGELVSNALLPVSALKERAYKVPNIVHYVSVGCERIFTFTNYLSVLSVRKFVKPYRIYFHGDCLPKGHWWQRTVQDIPNIFFRERMRTKYIQGGKPRFVEHETDIIRIQVLLDEGGIYMDTDVLVLASLNELMNYSVTQGRESDGGPPGSSFVMAKPNAPYMCLWLNAYREYALIDRDWAGYAVAEPSKISKAYPELVHLEESSILRPNYAETSKIYAGFYDWSKNYAMHLWNIVASKNKTHPIPKDPADIPKEDSMTCTVHELFRFIYYGEKIIHAKKSPGNSTEVKT